MNRYIMFLAALLVAMSMYAQSVQAHTPSQGSQGYSEWKKVTWNPKYESVRHKHVSNGTVCQAERNSGRIQQFKLVSLNATDRDCVANPNRQG